MDMDELLDTLPAARRSYRDTVTNYATNKRMNQIYKLISGAIQMPHTSRVRQPYTRSYRPQRRSYKRNLRGPPPANRRWRRPRMSGRRRVTRGCRYGPRCKHRRAGRVCYQFSHKR